LDRRTLRLTPWVLFFPPDEPSEWLGSDVRFTEAFLEWLDGPGRTSAVVALVQVLLRHHPVGVSTYPQWLEGLREVLSRSRSVRLDRWAVRQKEWRLFNEGGPADIAARYLDSNLTGAELVEDTGLQEAGDTGRYLEAVCGSSLALLGSRLDREPLEPAEVHRILSLCLVDEYDVRTRRLADSMANLLLPALGRCDPPPQTRKYVQDLLLRAIGDPRIQRGPWNSIDPEAKKVMLRWLVSLTLEAFFRLLDQTALDRHWEQRKAFWKGYLDADVISDAWLVLGKHARELGKSRFETDLEPVEGRAGEFGQAGGTWGRLGKGGDNSQSVLLMRLANLTIVEWSHNGTCRIWLEGNDKAPRLYESDYRRFHLYSDSCDFSQRHYPPHRWPRNVSRWIEGQTGVRHPDY
jgi:hypothetical protein